jgi:hypothetical protein
MSAAFSPIIIAGALVLPDVSVGMIEASATRRPAIPWTRSWASTTAIGSDPILQVPTGWYFAHLKGGHGGRGHDLAGDADRVHRQLRVGRRRQKLKLVNSPDPADREAVVQRDLANVLHPIVQHKVLETKQMVVTGGEGSTVVDADGTS